jgi:hypothetical protein
MFGRNFEITTHKIADPTIRGIVKDLLGTVFNHHVKGESSVVRRRRGGWGWMCGSNYWTESEFNATKVELQKIGIKLEKYGVKVYVEYIDRNVDAIVANAPGEEAFIRPVGIVKREWISKDDLLTYEILKKEYVGIFSVKLSWKR